MTTGADSLSKREKGFLVTVVERGVGRDNKNKEVIGPKNEAYFVSFCGGFVFRIWGYKRNLLRLCKVYCACYSVLFAVH